MNINLNRVNYHDVMDEIEDELIKSLEEEYSQQEDCIRSEYINEESDYGVEEYYYEETDYIQDELIADLEEESMNYVEGELTYAERLAAISEITPEDIPW